MPETTHWQPIDTLDAALKDGRDLLLHVDWEPLTVVGFWGKGEGDGGQSEDPAAPLYDDGAPTWRVRWDSAPLHWGFDGPTHWAFLPPTLEIANAG